MLSNQSHKGIFDKYGEWGLKNELGQMVGGYIFLGNSEEIYDKYFEDDQTLNRERFEYDGSDMFGSLNGDAHGAKRKPKPTAPKNVEVNIKCSLIEFYNGSLKMIKYRRDKIYPDGRSITSVEEEFQVEIQPGMDTKTVLTFAGLGNEQFHNTRSNLVIKLSLDESVKTGFMRSGNNLIYTHSMSLKDALKCAPVSFKSLDNRCINLNIDQNITPQTVQQLKGEGMPLPKETTDVLPLSALPKGDLFIKFDIVFPTNMTADQRNQILALLRKNAAETDS